MARIEAVFFDLYETLVTEFDPNWQPRPTPAERLGISAEAFDAEWRARHQTRMTSVHLNYGDVLREICTALAHEVDHDVLEQLVAERLADKAAPFASVEPEIFRMLRKIRQSGVKLGLISNCAIEEVAFWGTSGLAEFFNDAVFSYQVEYAKPDTQIYRLACERLGVVPERSIFVGDGGSDELTGAARAGLLPFHACWFLDRWPKWRRNRLDHETAADYRKLHAPAEVIDIVANQAAPSATRGKASVDPDFDIRVCLPGHKTLYPPR